MSKHKVEVEIGDGKRCERCIVEKAHAGDWQRVCRLFWDGADVGGVPDDARISADMGGYWRCAACLKKYGVKRGK